MKFLNNLDLQQNQLLNARAHSGVAPTNPKEGMFYYNTTDDNFWVYTGDEVGKGWKPALYVLPIATNNILGGVKAAPKTGGGTVEVQISSDGKLYVPTYPTYPDIPDVTLVGNTAETNKYISSASVVGHKITFNKEALPSETDPVFTAWDKSTGISITESQISDLGTYLTNETDPAFTAWDKSTGISITKSQITDLIEATQSLSGLMSATDKQRLDVLHALLEEDEANTVVDSINEVLSIFNNYPEGADLVTALAGKVNTEEGKGLSTNDLTDALKSNYNTAYSWGNHAVEGYLKAITKVMVETVLTGTITSHNHNGTYEPANANIQSHISSILNPHSVTKAQVGLGNVDNTSDVNKPVSTAQQAALDDKVDKETGKGLSANNLTDDLKDDYDAAYSHTSLTNNPHGVTTTQIGAEPEFSKNTAFNKNFGTALNTVAQGNHLHTGVYEPANANIQSHISSILNPHSVTKAQVGLDNVDNTSDLDKPVSTAQQAALDDKVDKETGKGLSTNDYTTLEKNKLANIASGAEVNVQSDWEAASGDAFIKNKPVILTKFIDEITLSDGVNGIMSVEHGLGTKDVIVSLRDSFDEFVYCNVTATTANQIQIKTANVAVGTVFQVTIIG